jgi:hypothetical protein
MKIIDCRLFYRENNKIKSAQGFENDLYSIEVQEDKLKTGGIYTAELAPAGRMELIRLEIVME